MSAMMSSHRFVRWRRRLRARWLGRYPRRTAEWRARAARAGSTRSLLLRARDTVATETFASWATSTSFTIGATRLARRSGPRVDRDGPASDADQVHLSAQVHRQAEGVEQRRLG